MAVNDDGGRPDVGAIAAEVFGVLDTGRQLEPISARHADFTIEMAYRAAAGVRQMREARGERPIGRKIGFTNRAVWGPYGYPPMWGYVYDRTVHDIAAIDGTLALGGFAEPRIEPEIVFGLGSAPRPEMDDTQLLSCLAWAAQGFEIVQSLFAGWKFSAPDAIAAFGLHGALLIGPRQSLAGRPESWITRLSDLQIDLKRDGVVVDRGSAANVLGSPLSALRHLVDLLDGSPFQPPLAAGEIVTTGTLTGVPPVAAGEIWTTDISGIPLGAVSVRFGDR